MVEKLDLFKVDSVFNQEKYELAVNDGTVDDKINESFAINYPGDAALNNSRGRTRWDICICSHCDRHKLRKIDRTC